MQQAISGSRLNFARTQPTTTRHLAKGGPSSFRAPSHPPHRTFPPPHGALSGTRIPWIRSGCLGRLVVRSSAEMRCEEPADNYRRNVGIVLLNERNEAFSAIRMRDKNRYWQMPQGGIDAGEDPWTAAQRELYEETGVKDIELITEASGWLLYDFPPEVRARLSSSWRRYRGQAQKWFLVKLAGPESQIDISGLGHKPEFSEWKWQPLERLPAEVVPFKRDVYSAVVAEFQQALATEG